MENISIIIPIIIALVISNGFILYLYINRSNQIGRAEEEKQLLKNQNDILKKENENIIKELKETKDENNETISKYKKLKAELFDLVSKNKNLSEKVEAYENIISEYEDKIRRLNIELEDIKGKASKADNAQKDSSASDKDSISNLQKIISEQNNKIKELEKKILLYESEYKLEEYKNIYHRYQNRIKILEEQVGKLKQLAQEKSREVSSLKIKNENLDKAYMAIRGELAAALDRIAGMKGEEGAGPPNDNDKNG